jgi:hypothetical protein
MREGFMAVAGVLAWETIQDTGAVGYDFESEYQGLGFLGVFGIKTRQDGAWH